MSSLAWLVILFCGLLFMSIGVYILVIKFFYWGDKKEPPSKRH